MNYIYLNINSYNQFIISKSFLNLPNNNEDLKFKIIIILSLIINQPRELIY